MRDAVPFLTHHVDEVLPGLALRLRRAKHRLTGSVEMAVMERYVGKGDLVLDIGARRGLFTAVLADLVGPDGRVDAFEPFPPNVAALRRLFDRRPQVRVHDVALSGGHRTATLRVPLAGSHPNTALGSVEPGNGTGAGVACVEVEVPCRRLDDALADRLRPARFIKCDVEGHELAVFRGGARLLMADRPVVLTEIEQRHTDEAVSSRFDLFASLGYAGYFLQRGHPPRPVKEFEPARHQATGAGRSYVNMFLFLPDAGEAPPADLRR